MSGSSTPSSDKSDTWIVSLSKPYQYAILALLALYAPSAIGQGPLFEPYLQLLLFVSLVFGSLLISTTNLAGPLRYAYHNYKLLIDKAHPLISLATAKVTAWAPLPFLVLALLPWFRTWFFMGVIPLTWQFVREEHQEAVSDISNRIDECCANAEAAANKALADAAAAKQDKHDLEQNLKATDFYNASSAAWATLDEQSSAQNDMHLPTARGVLATKAKAVATTVHSVIADVAGASDAAQKSFALASEIRNLVAKVKTAAEEGRMTDVKTHMTDANDKLKAAEEASSKASTARQNVRTHAREVYLAWQVVCEAYRQAIASITLRTNAITSKAMAAVDRARNDKAAVEGDMLRAFDVAAAALRDAQAGEHLRAADFFEVLPAAWTELHLFEEAVNEAVKSAETFLSTTTSAMEPPPHTQFNMKRFRSLALEVTGALDDLKNDTKRVKERFTTYEPARERVEDARDAQKHYAQEAARLAAEVSKASRDAAHALVQASKSAREVEEHGAAARNAMMEGDVDRANGKAQQAETGLGMVVAAAENAWTAKEKAEGHINAIVALTTSLGEE